MRADSKGNLFAAGGSNAKVLRLDAQRQDHDRVRIAGTRGPGSRRGRRRQPVRRHFTRRKSLQGNPVRAIVRLLRSQDEIHLGPGRGQRWNPVRRDGRYGQDFCCRPGRQGTDFYSSEETHIRSLALDSNGNVLAGTEPSGLVLRIPKAANARRAFVLYETSKKEITALLQDASGNLYVAAVGEKTPPIPGQPRPQRRKRRLQQASPLTIGRNGKRNNVSPHETQPFLSRRCPP